MATKTEMLLESAINVLAKIAGISPEVMRQYISQTTGMMNTLGTKAIEADRKLDTIILQNKATHATLARMEGNSVNLQDDDLLIMYPPGTGPEPQSLLPVNK